MTEVLMAAIKESGVSRYRIAKDTGVTEATLCRFVQGETSLRLDKADLLAQYLGLELRKRRGEPKRSDLRGARYDMVRDAW